MRLRVFLVLILLVCVCAEEDRADPRPKTAKFFTPFHGLRAAVIQSVLSIAPLDRIWSWTSRILGTFALPNIWSFLKLPVQKDQLLSEVQAMKGEQAKKPQSLGFPRLFFAAMVAKSVISWCAFPVLGPSGVLETAAMVVGLGQAYLAEHLKSFSDLYLMYKTELVRFAVSVTDIGYTAPANTDLKDQVGVYQVLAVRRLGIDIANAAPTFQGENGQLKESNSRLERSLQQLELIRSNLQEMLMLGAGTAESVEEAMKKMEEKAEETMEVLRSQKQSFEEQKEAFRIQEAACLSSREQCVGMKEACEANRRQKLEKWMTVV